MKHLPLPLLAAALPLLALPLTLRFSPASASAANDSTAAPHAAVRDVSDRVAIECAPGTCELDAPLERTDGLLLRNALLESEAHEVFLQLSSTSGKRRFFIHAHDGHGSAASACVPFVIQAK